MASKKDILLEISDLNETAILVETYEEIAAARIRRIRSSVVQTRKAISELSDLYHELVASHKREVEKLQKKGTLKANSPMLLSRNGKTLCILLSANTGLFGEIINKTFSLFETEIKKRKVDIAIIGKLGATAFKRDFADIPFTYFDYPDNGTDSRELGEITKLMVQYEQVFVFHGQFQTVVTQVPVISNLYGVEETKSTVAQTAKKYLFEPSLAKILQFFEAEIFASIFEQTIHESQLSKNASRMLLLDSASGNINTTLKKSELRLRILKHRETNSKQINALTGMSLWKR